MPAKKTISKQELIDLYYQIEATAEERKRLGDFDANSRYVMALLDGLQTVVEHAIEMEGKLAMLKKGPKK